LEALLVGPNKACGSAQDFDRAPTELAAILFAFGYEQALEQLASEALERSRHSDHLHIPIERLLPKNHRPAQVFGLRSVYVRSRTKQVISGDNQARAIG
jgi:hypothetical protein